MCGGNRNMKRHWLKIIPLNVVKNELIFIYSDNLNYTETGLFENCIQMQIIGYEMENDFTYIVPEIPRFRD